MRAALKSRRPDHPVVSQFDCGGVEVGGFDEASSSALIKSLYAPLRGKNESPNMRNPKPALAAENSIRNVPRQINIMPTKIEGTISRHMTKELILPDLAGPPPDRRVVINATTIVATAPIRAAIIVATDFPLLAARDKIVCACR